MTEKREKEEEKEKKPGATLSGAVEQAIRTNAVIRDAMTELGRSLAKVPDFSLPGISSPEFRVPELPLPGLASRERLNDYQSAAVLMMVLAEEAMAWKERLPASYKPAILALLHGGIQVHVQTLAQVSFHGIRIEGTLNGAPCSLLAHQSTVQLLCYAEEISAENPGNPIGFVWEDRKIEV